MSFEDILNKRADDVERPKPLPVGSYVCIINGPPEVGPVGQKQTLAAKYSVRPLMAREDVDQTLLSEAGGLDKKQLTHTLWLTEDSLWRTKEFLEALGVDLAGKTMREGLFEAVNRQFIAKIKHRNAQDGSQTFAEIGEVAAL